MPSFYKAIFIFLLMVGLVAYLVFRDHGDTKLLNVRPQTKKTQKKPALSDLSFGLPDPQGFTQNQPPWDQDGDGKVDANFSGIQETFYDEKKARIKRITVYKNGQLHGVQRSFFENGLPFREVAYEKGVQRGLYKEYFETGGLFHESRRDASLEHPNAKNIVGAHKIYYRSGELKETFQYAHGEMHGPYFKYSKSGQIEVEMLYQNGKLSGLESYYDKDGNLRKQYNHDDGRVKIFDKSRGLDRR